MDFFANGKYLGSAPAPAYDPRTISTYNIAWFCQACGEVWGRVVVNPASKWHVLNRACSNCGPRWDGDEAGCITHPIADWKTPQLDITKDTPFAVLLNEFTQLEKHYGNSID